MESLFPEAWLLWLLQIPLDVLITGMLYIPFMLGLAGTPIVLAREVLVWLHRADNRSTESRVESLASHSYGLLTFGFSTVLLVMSILLFRKFQLIESGGIAFLNLPQQRFLIFSLDYHIDALSVYFILLVNVVSWFASWHAIKFPPAKLGSGPLQRPPFLHFSLNMFHLTMMLVPFVDNLIVLWIAIELTTLFSAVTVGYQNSAASWEAAWKYLIITSTGIILALLGTIFLADAVSALQSSNPTNPSIQAVLQSGVDPVTKIPLDKIMNWTFLMSLAQVGAFSSPPGQVFVVLSFLFIVVGYGTKAGLAPMHTWLPDGHGEAPAPMSALLSGVLIKCAFYAILRFYTLTNVALGSATFTSCILLVVGMFSLLMAVPFIITDPQFKRVLAFHSLEHMGIIVLGVAIGGLLWSGKNSQPAVFQDLAVPVASIAMFGALLHIFNHAATKSLMFLCYGNILRIGEQVRGTLFRMPITSGILILGGLALVGMPPFSIFMSEYIIVWGSLSEVRAAGLDLWGRSGIIVGALILFVLSTSLIFVGLVRHMARLTLNAPDAPQDKLSSSPPMIHVEKIWETFPLLLLLLLILIFGIAIPSPLANLLSSSVNVILHYNISYP